VLATGSVYLVGDLLAHAHELGLHAGLGAQEPAATKSDASASRRKGGAR
jgi:hypothetical protein